MKFGTARNVVSFSAECVAEGGKKLCERTVQFWNIIVVGSWTDKGRMGRALQMTFHMGQGLVMTLWQGQYLVTLGGDTSCSAHCT